MGRRRKGEAVSGWICLDKPYDLTSTHAVSRVRRAFNAQKAGHAGTLDPLATGILPIAGETVELTPRAVTIHSARVAEALDPDHVTLEIECGKGTYVRALARDLAERLGACGHVSALRRTRVGGFTEQSAVTLELLE